MNGLERKPVTGYLWAGLAVLTCPCHLPILAVVLAGTSAGAFLGEHWVVAALGLAGLFLLSVARALRAFRGKDHERFRAERMDGGATGSSRRARAA